LNPSLSSGTSTWLPELPPNALLNTDVLAEISEVAAAITAASIVGLFVGSFVNVVVYRAPRGLSVAAPRSFCPTCNRQLSWWENIPVASWVVLRARCRTCHQSISARYPTVELITAFSFGLVTWGWHGTATAVGYCGLAATMISIACIEYGGLRSPLSVAAVGSGASEAAILVASGILQHWRIGVGSIVGLAVGVLAYALLRTLDPDCAEPLGHGRSALLVAGAWIGGLAAVPIAAGIATGIAVFLVSMVGARLVAREAPSRVRGDRPRRKLPPVLAAPLVTAISAALVVSLVVAR
jgi:prepilin signal peptidase PulO-like enzyme (type II secretory pathway)